MERGNKQIWRISKYLFENLFDPADWENVKGLYYHTVAELLKKLSLNEFTNGDDHAD